MHDFGEAGGVYYLVMEYVEGASLRDLQRSGSVTPSDALSYIRQICEALQYAHDQGIVHRDVKPENILIDQDGRLHIADFGLAKILADARGEVQLTGSEQVFGTPHYMAPEQIGGARDVDHRADIYSLGVVFYEMLTGELPIGRFDAPSKKNVRARPLDDVVMRSLENEPERRYQVARELQRDLDAARMGAPRQKPARSSSERARRSRPANESRPTRMDREEPVARGVGSSSSLWIDGALVALVLIAHFLPWVTIGTSFMIEASIEGPRAPVEVIETTLTGWDGTFTMGSVSFPPWILLVLAVLAVALRSARTAGAFAPPRWLVLLDVALGLLVSGIFVLLFLTGEKVLHSGLGSQLVFAAFLYWLVTELRGWWRDHQAAAALRRGRSR